MSITINNCTANAAMQLDIIDKAGKSRKTTILFNSEDDWCELQEISNLSDLFSFFSVAILKHALLDESIDHVRGNVFQIVDGQLDLIVKMDAMYKTDGTFKAVRFEKNGVVAFLND